jgi:D-alanine-D-alanine ligase-like ATP-grasp enzyme
MKVAIISGGKNKKLISSESANNIFMELHDHAEKIFNIKIDEDGNWHNSGIKTTPHATLTHVDYVIDMTHDTHDNKTKDFIKKLGLRHLVTNEYDHNFIRQLAHQLDVKTPNYEVLKTGSSIEDFLHDKWRRMHLPLHVKSSDNKTPTLKTYNPEEAYRHMIHIHGKKSDVILDEVVIGRKVSLVTISKFRNEKVYVTPIVEKTRINNKKILTNTRLSSDEEKNTLLESAIKMHSVLDSKILKHDYAITKNGPVLLNIETKINYTKKSSAYHILESVGINFAEIIKTFK